MKQEPIKISGVWLRRIGRNAEVLVEVDGQWRLVITEPLEANFGHIVEPSAILSAPKDSL